MLFRDTVVDWSTDYNIITIKRLDGDDKSGKPAARSHDELLKSATDVVAAVQELTHGERIHCLIESAGVAPLYKQIPALIRKQATIVMYGHGHHGVDLGVMNNIQFIEPTVIMPTGASGGFDADRRPSVYRRSLELLSAGKINVSKFLTHQYTALEDVPRGFERDRFEPGYIKGVATF